MNYEILTRKQALQEGRKRFYTGKPCIHNHLAQRFVTTGGCVACNADRSKLFSKDANAKINATRQGLFTYPLHKDDFAAALAYCQGLDLTSGRRPYVPAGPTISSYAEPFHMPAHIAKHRAELLEVMTSTKARPYVLEDLQK